MAEVRAQELMDRVLPVVQARHAQAWLAGGWVRDRLLGIERRDFDFVVPGGAVATARRVADAVGGPFVLLDAGRDTARVLVGPPEAPIYLDFAGLRASSIEEDLLARDFTINAMAVPVAAWRDPEGAIIDPAGGRRDLAIRLLRAVSSDSFRQDPLRMLRAVRLRTALGFELESQTAAWIQRDAALLDAVSRERVRDELAQILDLPRTKESLRLLNDLSLLSQAMPEVARLRQVPVAGGEVPNALERSLQAVHVVEMLLGWLRSERDLPPGWPYEMLADSLVPYRERLAHGLAVVLPGGRSAGVLLTLAALLYDVARGASVPATPTENHLLGREVLSASMAATIMRRLCFSSAETVRVRLTVRSHARAGELVEEMDGEPTRRAVYRFFRDAEPSGVDALLLSLVDGLAARGPGLDRDRWRRHLALVTTLLHAYYERRREVVEPLPLVDGYELMTALDLSPGPEVGALLESIREAQAAGEIHSPAEALEMARQSLERGGPY